MAATTRQPGIVSGAVIGLILTAALIAVSYAAWQLLGLPFASYDLFDWTGRVLPGQLVTRGIDTMVAVIRALKIGPTSVVAKTAEHALAITNLLIAGIVLGAVLFTIFRLLRSRHARALGLIVGLAVSIIVLAITLHVGQTASAPPVVSGIWTILLFTLWGFAYGWVFDRLSTVEPVTAGAPAEDASVERIDRRSFLIRLGGTTAAITVAGTVVGRLYEAHRNRAIAAAGPSRWSATHPLPNADAAVKPAPGTRPEFTPLEQHYRIDINTTPPTIPEQDWRLKVGGLVDQPLVLTLDDLRRYEPLHQFITLACISNPVGGDLTSTTRWTGVSLKRLLPDLHLKPSATHLKIRSADGFYEIVPLETINSDERVMLTYAWDGVPLVADHGFPLRIYIPDHYGMKQPKWIESIEATDHWEPGYWVTRGWSKEARVRATSVIDTVAMNMMVISPDSKTLIPIGGIAHAGARGISKVEVKVDDGPWQQAQLRTPLSSLTWIIWRYNWPFQPGNHTFTVRCYEGNGTPQIETPAPVRPDGATGLNSKTQML